MAGRITAPASVAQRHVPKLHQRQRRLARHENQPAAFFQVNVGGAVDQICRLCRGRSRRACRPCKGKRPCRRSETSRWRSGPGNRGSGGNGACPARRRPFPARCSNRPRCRPCFARLAASDRGASPAVEHQHRGIEVVQIDTKAELLLEHDLARRADASSGRRTPRPTRLPTAAPSTSPRSRR